MKKIIFLPLSVLLIIFVILSAVDRSDYAVEKKMWRIQGELGFLARTANIVPAKRYKDLEDRCRDLIREYPQSQLLPQMHMLLAEVEMIAKDFEGARADYIFVLDRFPQQQLICAQALIGTGRSYLAQKRGHDAIAFYQMYIDKHPGSPLNKGLKKVVSYIVSQKS